MAWYDKLDPSSAGGAQLAGLFSGLGQLGAGLMQAGQMRPIGQPGPTLADAFGGFGQGRQAGLMSAMQQSQIQKMQARQALFAEAQSDKPDDAISAQARAIRQGLASLPEEARPFVGADEAGSLLVDRAKTRTRQLTAEELAAGGYRPGSVVYTNDWTGAPSVVQQPDTMSPEAEAQRLRISAAGRGPASPIILGPGQTAFGRDGQPIAAGPMPMEPLSPANAWNEILRYAPGVASTIEGGRKPDIHDLKGQLQRDHALADGEGVGVVVTAAEFGGFMAPAQ
jgi:hypothetical protein